MKRITIDFFVGMFVIIGILSIAFLSLKVATNNGQSNVYKTYTLHANFANIGSLKSNAPVKVSGFTVGRITDITLDPKNYKAIVIMDINDKYHFSTDASAQILTTGLLGEQYIGIQNGAEEAVLQNDETITMTSSALVLENLIGKFMSNISK